ncbi:hypothetical protein ZOSMA_356G00130 [Zostera marina]|uniref:Uncharacterized protein n=1 Tax=Zostera marina TaxID=29655 RepID=A0A0K9P6M5_ZOSMR|nr:hypothetical protein ZOSMA_356G00130 [Zostera marina]
MVAIHVKTDEENIFLFACLCSSSLQDITESVVNIHNLHSKIRFLSLRLHGCPNLPFSLQRAMSEADAYVSKDQVLRNQSSSPYVLRDHIRRIEKEAMEASLEDISIDKYKPVKEENAQIWLAGKRLVRDKQLCDYIGRNEKTKIVVTLKWDL